MDTLQWSHESNVRLDTVSLCGGSPSGSFFHIMTMTDAAVQWFGCAPSWNHGAAATADALAAVTGRLPMAVLHLHPDNGSEFINHLFIRRAREILPGVQVSRSRPYQKNDNCRTGQKNGSVISL